MKRITQAARHLIPLSIVPLLILVCGYCVAAHGETINEAVHRGDIATVQRMLDGDVRLARFRGDDSNTPLHWAAWDGRADIVKLLILAGADVNDRRAMDGGTPLFLAGWRGFPDVVLLLLQHGADPEIRSNDGNTPLHYAAAFAPVETAECFLTSGQNLETLNKEGDTPLGVAAVWGRTDVAQLLIAVGADLHHRNKAGQAILDVALAHKRDAFAAMLRAYQAELDDRAAREQARKASGIAIHDGFLNWAEPNLRAKQVYTADFAGATVGPEWSTLPLPGAQQAPLHISTTPAGKRRFLGELGSQAARLTLGSLPSHTEVSVYFDLYIIRTWDGNDPRVGPDIFTLSVVDGPTLLRTTFENPYLPERGRYRIQAYPGEYPGDHNLPHTGAVEVNTLGFTTPVQDVSTVMDSVYKLSYTFTHHGNALLLDFAAHGLEPLNNESWGITNVQVSVGSPAPAPILARRTVSTPHSPVSHTPARHVSPPKPPMITRRAITGKKPSGAKTSHSATRLHPKEKPPEL